MIEQAAFEIVGTEGCWRWELRDGETVLAMAAETFETPTEARQQAAQTRVAASRLSDDPLVDTETDVDGPVDVELFEREGFFLWHLTAGGQRLAVPPATYDSRAATQAAVDRIVELTQGAVPVHYKGADEATDRRPFVLERSELKQAVKTLLGRGRRHREFLDQLEARIVVMGIRGKSSTTRRLGDVFHRRGYDTLVKITGNRPHMIHNGDHIPIGRTGPRVTLYENIKTFWQYIPELDSYSPDGIGIFENQGITEYTTRMFNHRFAEPDVIVLTNVRQDHQDTLGKTRRDIARSFARSVPSGTHVISGEQHPLLDEYLREEVQKAGGTFKQVDVPEKHAQLIGAETVHAVNEVLAHFEMDPLPDSEIEGYLRAIQPEWTRLADGARIFNAAEVNDIESTEAVRRSVAGEEPIVPFVYLRRDRRSRTASFATYINTLIERGLVDRVFVAGDYTNVFAANIAAPVEEYPADADPTAVLDGLVETGLPIVLMGNTVAEFMRNFETEIERRATQTTHEETQPVAEPRQVASTTVDEQPLKGPAAVEPPTEATVHTADELNHELTTREIPVGQQRRIVELLEQLPDENAASLPISNEPTPSADEPAPTSNEPTPTSNKPTPLADQGKANTETETEPETDTDVETLLSRLDSLDETVADTDSALYDLVDRFETRAEKRDTTTGDETEPETAELATRVAHEVDRLEAAFAENRTRLRTLQELEGRLLREEIQEAVEKIDDPDRLQELLGAVSQTQEETRSDQALGMAASSD